MEEIASETRFASLLMQGHLISVILEVGLINAKCIDADSDHGPSYDGVIFLSLMKRLWRSKQIDWTAPEAQRDGRGAAAIG